MVFSDRRFSLSHYWCDHFRPFPGDAAPVVRGSALAAYEGKDISCVEELLAALDSVSALGRATFEKGRPGGCTRGTP